MVDLWQELSYQCVPEAYTRLANCKSVLGGFNLCVDRIKHLNSFELDRLFEKCKITETELNQAVEQKDVASLAMEQSTSIHNCRSFIEMLIKCLVSGDSREIPISDEKVFKWLNSMWKEQSVCKVGGQPAYMALAAHNLVGKIVLLGWPTSETFLDKMPKLEKLYIAILQNNQVYVKSIVECKDFSSDDYANWAIEFPKDLQIRKQKFNVKTSRAGRLIANWSPRKKWMEQGTSDHVKNSGINVTHAFLSGCQILHPDSDSNNLWEKQLSELSETIDSLRNAMNCQAIHYEMGNVSSQLLLQTLVNEVLPNAVNSIGCNEVELAHILEAVEAKDLASQLRNEIFAKRTSIATVYRGVSHLVKKCNLQRVHVHTWDFHVSVCRTKDFPSTSELNALLFGTIMGAARTFTNEDIKIKHIEYGLGTPFSKDGLTLVKQLHEKPEVVGECVNYGTFKTDDEMVYIVPGRVKSILESTIGLGDTLSSMAFLVSAG